MTDTQSGNNSEEGSEDYKVLSEIEELESLLEVMEEDGVTGDEDASDIPTELREELEAHGVRNVYQLREKLLALHAEVDDDDRDREISES